MNKDFLSDYVEGRRLSTSLQMGIIIFKPECPPYEQEAFRKYCDDRMINILLEEPVRLSKTMIIALYPAIFKFLEDDLVFGIGWKQQMITYLQSADCHCFLVKGASIQERLAEFKYALRERHHKITHPKDRLSTAQFLETVIKNFIHVVDVEEIPNALWLLSRD